MQNGARCHTKMSVGEPPIAWTPASAPQAYLRDKQAGRSDKLGGPAAQAMLASPSFQLGRDIVTLIPSSLAQGCPAAITPTSHAGQLDGLQCFTQTKGDSRPWARSWGRRNGPSSRMILSSVGPAIRDYFSFLLFFILIVCPMPKYCPLPPSLQPFPRMSSAMQRAAREKSSPRASKGQTRAAAILQALLPVRSYKPSWIGGTDPRSLAHCPEKNLAA